MLPLLMKDIQISKRYLLYGFLGIGIIFFVTGDFAGGILPLISPFFLSYFLIVTNNKADEKNNNGRMLASLPLRRKDIINAKYWSLLMFTALAFLFAIIWRQFFLMISPHADLHLFNVQIACIYLLSLSAYFSFYYPIYFAFGARIVLIIEYILVFVIALVPLITLRSPDKTILFINNFSFESSIFWLAGICLVIMFLSWLLSNFVYNRRNI